MSRSNPFNGNVLYRAGSQDPKKLRLVSDEVESLSGVQEIELKLFDRDSNDPKNITIKLTDAPQLLTIIDSDNKIIQILAEENTFTKITLYDYYVRVKDVNDNWSAWPIGFNYIWEVISG